VPKDDHTFPTEDEIAELCHALMLDRMASRSSITDCWRRAETQLLERAADRVLKPYRVRDRR
jgi:hypothetical protein